MNYCLMNWMSLVKHRHKQPTLVQSSRHLQELLDVQDIFCGPYVGLPEILLLIGFWHKWHKWGRIYFAIVMSTLHYLVRQLRHNQSGPPWL